MSISRNSITLINPDEGNGATARQTKIDFMGFSDGEVDINDVFTGVGATTQSTGSGLNDITFGGTYTGTTAVTYYLKIDATGTPDTFSWSKDNFSSTEATGVSLTGSAQTLDTGVTVTAGATTGHTLNDVWQMTTVVDITDPHILAQILVDHEGTSADDKGELAIKVNDGNDGQTPSKTVMTGHANGDVTFGGSATVTGDLTVSGTTTTISTTNLVIEDKVMTLNDGGAASSGGSVGLEVEENGSATGFFKTNDTGDWTIRGANGAAAATATIDVNTDAKTLTIAGSLNIEADSAINQDVTSDAGPTFAGVTSTDDLTAKTSDGALLTLQTSETTCVDGDVLGGIKFQAPNDSAGTDAIAIAGSIECVAETTFTSSVNKTEMVFKTAASGAVDVTNVTMHSNAAVTFAGTVIESSARELKENIQPLTNSLDKVMAMQGVSFDWKNRNLGTDVGMVADDVSLVLPELVSYENEKPSGIKYSKMVSVLVEAMKEQQNQIEELKAEIKAMKN